MIAGLRALADHFDGDSDDLDKLDRLVTAVVKRKTREFPHLQEDVEAEVIAALWLAAASPPDGSGLSGHELLRRAWDIARSAANETLDLLARPMTLDDRTRRRASEVTRLRDEHGLSLTDATAQADVTVSTFIAAIDAAASGYLDPADLDRSPDDDHADDASIKRNEAIAAAVRDLSDDDRQLHDALHNEGPYAEPPGLPHDLTATTRPVIVACAVCIMEPARPGSLRCHTCHPAPDDVEPWTHPTQRDMAKRLGVSQSTISRRTARIARRLNDAVSGSAAP